MPFFLVTALFFLWGIPNNQNDVLIQDGLSVLMVRAAAEPGNGDLQ